MKAELLTRIIPFSISNYNASIRKHNLILHNTIARQPVGRRLKRHATPQQIPAYADLGLAPARDDAAMPLKHGVDILPFSARLQIRQLYVRVVVGPVEVGAQVDSDAAGDVVAVGPIGVPAAADRKRQACIGQDFDGLGNLSRGPRLEDVRRMQLGAVAPVGLDAKRILGVIRREDTGTESGFECLPGLNFSRRELGV